MGHRSMDAKTQSSSIEIYGTAHEDRRKDMESILDWGTRVVIWFQQFSPALDVPFKAFTFMGEQPFFMLLLPLVYWCVNRRIGARLTILFLFSAHLNMVAKVPAAQPRPYQYDPRVFPLYKASGGGFPSGHTQNAVVVWGYLASHFRRLEPWIFAGLLMLFIPISRLYLGVHFPTDLLGGYIMGVILLLLYLRLEPVVEAWLKEKGLACQLYAGFLVPLLLVLLVPNNGKYGIITGATLMGMGVGFAFERRWVRFESGGMWWKRILRFLVGVTVLFTLWLGLRTAFYGLEPEQIYNFLRYALVGLWSGLGAPWLFVRLHLAERR
jgi:membrane-associated phospholipid phosphatase